MLTAASLSALPNEPYWGLWWLKAGLAGLVVPKVDGCVLRGIFDCDFLVGGGLMVRVFTSWRGLRGAMRRRGDW